MPYCYQCCEYIKPRQEQHRDIVTSFSKRGKVRTSRKPLCFVCCKRFDIKSSYTPWWTLIAIFCALMLGASFITQDLTPLIWCLLLIPVGIFLYLHYEKRLDKFNAEIEKEKCTPVSQLIEDLEKADLMTGIDFEYFCGSLLQKVGYKVTFTSATGDRGIDIIAEKNNRRLGVQTKRYFKKVGIGPIQEVVAGRLFHKVDDMLVITNSYFTLQALELAKINNVTLWDREHLSKILTEIGDKE